jgi:hypothetical protein
VERWIVFNRRELRSPFPIAAGLAAFSIWRSEWIGLLGLPLIFLGWWGCAPNLNLADGCLPILATGIILVVGAALGSAGLLAAATACGVAWLGASLESAWRCRPYEP